MDQAGHHDVGVLIPLHEEYQYLAELAPPVRTIRVESDYYYELMPHEQGPTIVVQVLEEMGPLRAAVAADRMLRRFGVRIIALVGLAGALNHDLRLGDVVVASEVEYYQQAGKVTPAAGRGKARGVTFQRGGTAWRTDEGLLGALRAFPKMPETSAAYHMWKTRTASRRPVTDADIGDPLARPSPEVYFGPIASGDVVGAAADFGSWLRSHNRKLIAMEMEGAGVAMAAEARNTPARWLVVRGISDFADARKDELDTGLSRTSNETGVWRRYAMGSASEFLIGLLPMLRGLESLHPGGPSEVPAQSSDFDQYELEAEFASRYGTERAARRVLAHAGLDVSHLDLTGSPRELWYVAITTARSQGSLAALVAAALRDYPGITAFQRARTQVQELS